MVEVKSDIKFVASELKDAIWHSLEWQIGSFSSEATLINKISEWLTSILSNLNHFHLLEVVDRVCETQLQVGVNSN